MYAYGIYVYCKYEMIVSNLVRYLHDSPRQSSQAMHFKCWWIHRLQHVSCLCSGACRKVVNPFIHLLNLLSDNSTIVTNALVVSGQVDGQRDSRSLFNKPKSLYLKLCQSWLARQKATAFWHIAAQIKGRDLRLTTGLLTCWYCQALVRSPLQDN